ncbi:hypothetical protein CYMTET_17392 [Cymbomonas tetramitiformis]|uniref:Uncharacterized protein n=1 Tax=Cymbomonas tetramitiformis TaxID=36881 RepID=A0AAE0GAH8_9CHLO|nr:hypothetical protein CYMTET_17392 [Cymbomonas tetramitiformis]
MTQLIGNCAFAALQNARGVHSGRMRGALVTWHPRGVHGAAEGRKEVMTGQARGGAAVQILGVAMSGDVAEEMNQAMKESLDLCRPVVQERARAAMLNDRDVMGSEAFTPGKDLVSRAAAAGGSTPRGRIPSISRTFDAPSTSLPSKIEEQEQKVRELMRQEFVEREILLQLKTKYKAPSAPFSGNSEAQNFRKAISFHYPLDSHSLSSDLSSGASAFDTEVPPKENEKVEEREDKGAKEESGEEEEEEESEEQSEMDKQKGMETKTNITENVELSLRKRARTEEESENEASPIDSHGSLLRGIVPAESESSGARARELGGTSSAGQMLACQTAGNTYEAM